MTTTIDVDHAVAAALLIPTRFAGRKRMETAARSGDAVAARDLAGRLGVLPPVTEAERAVATACVEIGAGLAAIVAWGELRRGRLARAAQNAPLKAAMWIVATPRDRAAVLAAAERDPLRPWKLPCDDALVEYYPAARPGDDDWSYEDQLLGLGHAPEIARLFRAPLDIDWVRRTERACLRVGLPRGRAIAAAIDALGLRAQVDSVRVARAARRASDSTAISRSIEGRCPGDFATAYTAAKRDMVGRVLAALALLLHRALIEQEARAVGAASRDDVWSAVRDAYRAAGFRRAAHAHSTTIALVRRGGETASSETGSVSSSSAGMSRAYCRAQYRVASSEHRVVGSAAIFDPEVCALNAAAMSGTLYLRSDLRVVQSRGSALRVERRREGRGGKAVWS